MMFRDYYRDDTPAEIKSLIKEVVTEKGKTIPPEAVIKKRIVKPPLFRHRSIVNRHPFLLQLLDDLRYGFLSYGF